MKFQGRNLTTHIQGEDVQILQHELSKLGYSISISEVEKNFFGEATRNAVRDFQQHHQLEATGVVDEQTAQRISAAVEALQPPLDRLRVIGQVVGQNDIPFQAATVKVFDKELRSEELLGEATTDENGHYEITYTAGQLRQANKQRADLLVRVFNREGTQLAESPLLFNAQPEATVNLVVEPHQAPVLSEYEHLLAQLRPLLENVQLAELTDEDIAFLARKTAIDQQGIELLRQAEQLSRVTGLAGEVLYGFARRNLPLSLERLLTQDPAELDSVLQSALEEHIISARAGEMFEAYQKRLGQAGIGPGWQEKQQRGVQQVTGQLLNQNTGEPLRGYTMRIVDLDAGPAATELGSAITNGLGQFVLASAPISPSAQQEGYGEEKAHRLRVHILDPQGVEIFQTEIKKTADQQKLEVAVPVHSVAQRPSPALGELAETLHRKLPSSLLSFLADHNIHTLADIRATGGISALEGLPLAANNRSVRLLEAHANLSVLSDDVEVNARLIEKGYTGIRTIAETPQQAFVQAVRDHLGDFMAAQMHLQARAEILFLSNVLTQIRADHANGLLDSSEPLTLRLFQEQDLCRCKDCQAAVSPAAYLLDLIDYTIHHLADSGQAIQLGWFTAHFHQPFTDLVVSCEAVETLVHQVRICIEVLRNFLPQGTEFPGESDYRREAYLTLLSKIGTSYEELRLARSMDPVKDHDKRQALADRLGIRLGEGTPGPDRLEQVLFDLSKPQTLTEQALENLFGLVDTTRNPLTASTEPQFLQWRLEFLRTLWHDQDRPPLPNAGSPIIDPDVISPADFRFPQEGNRYFDLWQARRKVVDDLKGAYESDYREHGLTVLLQKALVDPLPDLNELKKTLTQGADLEQTKAAMKEVTDSLHLTIESFNRLMAIQAKIDNNQPVSPEEEEELFAIATEAEKIKLYPSWIAKEQTQKIVLGPDQFWIALKEPNLAPWLATTEARQAWQQALRIRSQPPIIDPDLIGILDLKSSYKVDPSDPSYQIWKDRCKQRDDLKLEWETRLGNPPGNLVSLIEDVLGTPVTDLLGLADRRTKGEDINARLDQLSIDLAAYLRLLKLRTLIQSNQAVLDEEWQEFYSILLQVWKRRQFANWRDEEEAKHVLLSPDFFVIPAPTLLPEVPQPQFEPIKWRATVQARNDWQDTLQSRIDQQQSITDGLLLAIDACEEQTLPILRDALLMQIDPTGTDGLPSKAKWCTTNLLIDAQVDGCQKTTRIAQAIETLQMLLSSVRTGQLAGTPTYAGVTIDDRNFDDAWEWIGSYATWRAAMFVFLYPENVLVPTLRMFERQTPAFRNLVSALRPNRRLTPEQACEAASTYADYYRDVCHQTIEATCTALTRIHKGDCRHKTQMQDQYLFYLFARGPSTTVYWSTYDPRDQTGFGQTFWETLPGLDKALQIVGAVPYLPRDDQHSILLFAKTLDKGEQKLVMATYDLLTQRWSGDLVELELPQKGVDFSVVVSAQDKLDLPPLVVICLKAAPGTTYKYEDTTQVNDLSGKQVLYARETNNAGTGWADNDFYVLGWDSTWVRVLAIVSHLTSPDSPVDFSMLFVEMASGGFTVGIFPYHGMSLPFARGFFPEWIPITDKSLLGAFQYPRSGLVYIFVRDRKTGAVNYGTQLLYLSFLTKWDVFTFDYRGFSIERMAPHSGYDPAFNGRMLAYFANPWNLVELFTMDDNYSPHYSETTLIVPGYSLHYSETTLIAPVDSSPFDLTERLSEQELQSRSRYCYEAYRAISIAPSSNRTYLDEAYYFVPMFLALQLQQAGHYVAALDWFRTVYDYAAKDGDRNIWFGFELEQRLHAIYQRADDWFLDPLNPHQIAATRAGTYLRFTLLALVRCFLDYADAEFTRDTAESIPRARRLYMTALELLDLRALHQRFDGCEMVIGELDIPIESERVGFVDAYLLKQELARIPNPARLKAVTAQVQKVLHGRGRQEQRFAKAHNLIRKARESVPPPPTVAGLVEQRSRLAEQAARSLLARPEITETAQRIGNVVSQDFLQQVSSVAGINREQLLSQPVVLPWLFPSNTKSREHTSVRSRTAGTLTHWQSPEKIFPELPGEKYVPGPSSSIGFCIPQNPILMALRFRAELNLFKLRHCRNIAGDLRMLEPYVAPTDTVTGLPEIGTGLSLILPGVNVPPATPYRYTVLIERAKQLVSLAQQIEAAFLAALEKRDAEYYTLLKARQDVSLAKATVRLQNLRVTEAESGIKLAELQQARAQIEVDHYQKLLQDSWSTYEWASLAFLGQSALASLIASTLPSSVGGPLSSWSPQGSLSAVASSLSTTASIMSTLASYERRAQEWEFQKSLAQQDVVIGGQQVKIAQDHVRVVGQEQKIAELQSDHAEAIANFLGNKFTSYELYDWMSGVLEGVYNYLLQQATSVAQLALSQLAFERQQTPPPLIRADYWQPPSETGQSIDGKAPDRRGLTGSARLLQDITQLDQYRFDTEQRKLQLSKTISIAQLAPEALARFMETGVLTFATPMDLFDRDFPGHYLRLIRRVRVSVVALIPPTSGIRATLTSNRVSRVVVGGDTFQTVRLMHGPDSVALSAPRDATGLFELDIQSEMLLPFEGIGVDTTWVLRMPKAANQFDYRTIADVLFTVEYTALNSFTYYQQVIQSLNPRLSANRAYSFRNQFVDQWYDLHHPEQTANPMTVTFTTLREDFPPNLESLKIQHVVLYFMREADSTLEDIDITLHFTPQGETTAIGGQAKTVEGLISSRNGNGGSWTSMIGSKPIGTWELTLPQDPGLQARFKQEEIKDILFVLTYAGRTPEWPT